VRLNFRLLCVIEAKSYQVETSGVIGHGICVWFVCVMTDCLACFGYELVRERALKVGLNPRLH
jgi:hypothetical protein